MLLSGSPFRPFMRYITNRGQVFLSAELSPSLDSTQLRRDYKNI